MFLIFILLILDVRAVINPHGPTVVTDYVNCISDLMEQNFIKPGLLVFANADDTNTAVSKVKSELLKRINHSLKFLVKTAFPEKKLSICDENHLYDVSFLHMDLYEVTPLADYYLIIVENYKDFSRLASKIIKSRYWNSYAKFIIFFNSYTMNFRDYEKYVENILTCLFKYNVIDLIVVVPEVRNIRNTIIYGWRPYDPPKYCGYFNESAKGRLLVENMCERGVVKNRKSMFGDRLPSNMQKCALHILALQRNPFISRHKDDPNIEKMLVKSILRKYNFSSTYRYVNLFRGERDLSGNWDGALKEIVEKKSQLLLGGIFPDFDVHEDFECSTSYLADSYTWVIPRANPSPPWVALTIIFQNVVWYSAITGFMFCVITWKYLGQLSGDSAYNKSLDHCLLNTLIASLGFCAYMRPVKESLRVFFVFLNIYCIIFLTAYQTKLIVTLQNPTFDQQIDTVEELVTSGLKFGGYEELHDLFMNSTDPFDSLIGEKWIDIDNMTRALIDVTVYKNFSVLCSRLELAHISAMMPELNDAFGKYTYFTLDRDTFTVPMEMITLRGFPFMKHFSHTLNLYKQLGVNTGVRRNFTFYNLRKRANLLRSLYEYKDKFYPLTLEHLQGGFLALGLGVVVGTCIFILELLSQFEFYTNI